MALKSLVALYLLCFSIAYSQTPGRFTNPPSQDPPFGQLSLSGNPIYTAGKLLNITWGPSAQAMSLVMWQVNPEVLTAQIGGLQYLPGNSKNLAPNTSFFVWNPIGVDGNNNNPKFDLSTSNVFYFALYLIDGIQPLSISANLNFTDSKINAVGQPILTSISSSVIVSSTSTAAPSTSPTSPSTATTSSPAATTTISSGLSTGAKVGIGLGVSLGGAILIAILVGIFLLLKKRRTATPATAPAYIPWQTDYKPERGSAVPPYQANFPGSERHEMPATQ